MTAPRDPAQERASTRASARSGRTQLVTFRVGDDMFAADIFAVERVLRYSAPRPIPNVPAWIEGVIDYRGRIVPVIDLRSRFELAAAPSRESARILIVVSGEEWIGAIVDAVHEVATVTADQLSPPPPLFKGLAKQYLRGLVQRNKEGEPVIVLLDVAQLLTARERIVLEQAVAGATTNG
ncbi:MAG: chemotaxis protein CheW [Gemmatimonadales bacterium]